jgi:hypothetical protein
MKRLFATPLRAALVTSAVWAIVGLGAAFGVHGHTSAAAETRLQNDRSRLEAEHELASLRAEERSEDRHDFETRLLLIGINEAVQKGEDTGHGQCAIFSQPPYQHAKEPCDLAVDVTIKRIRKDVELARATAGL